MKITVGSKWVAKDGSGTALVIVKEIKDSKVHYIYDGGTGFTHILPAMVFMGGFEPKTDTGDDIVIGSRWVWSNNVGSVEVEVIDVAVDEDGDVIVTSKDKSGALDFDMLHNFREHYKPVPRDTKDDITVGSIWKNKEDGEEVYVESIDDSVWPVKFNSLDGDGEYANDVDGFLEQHEFISVGKPESISASSILSTAKDMLGERGKQYDTNGEERSMAKIVASFNAKTGRDLTELEGWLFMTDLKAVRALAGGSMDCFIDGAAYFALAGESVGEK